MKVNERKEHHTGPQCEGEVSSNGDKFDFKIAEIPFLFKESRNWKQIVNGDHILNSLMVMDRSKTSIEDAESMLAKTGVLVIKNVTIEAIVFKHYINTNTMTLNRKNIVHNPTTSESRFWDLLKTHMAFAVKITPDGTKCRRKHARKHAVKNIMCESSWMKASRHSILNSINEMSFIEGINWLLEQPRFKTYEEAMHSLKMKKKCTLFIHLKDKN
jgi:hypothetical protein